MSASKVENYDDVTQYGLSPQTHEALLLSQNELTFIWTTRDWFYPDFARHARNPAPTPEDFVAFLDTPARIIIEVVPEKICSLDGGRMRDATSAALQ